MVQVCRRWMLRLFRRPCFRSRRRRAACRWCRAAVAVDRLLIKGVGILVEVDRLIKRRPEPNNAGSLDRTIADLRVGDHGGWEMVTATGRS